MSILNQRLDFTINRYTLDELPFIEYPYRSTYIFKDTLEFTSSHNLLEGLQGGTHNEYFHLTLAQYESLQNLNNLYYPLNDNPANYATTNGTVNYLAKFTSSDSIGNSNIFDSGTNIGLFTNNPLFALHLLKSNVNVELVTETKETNRYATNNVLTDVSGVSIASFGSAYPEFSGSRWAGRSGVYINTGRPNQTFNVWIGTRTIINSLPNGQTAIGQQDPEAWLHVQGDLMVDNVLNGVGNFLTISPTGLIQQRTAEELLSDIGGQRNAGAGLSLDEDGKIQLGSIDFYNYGYDTLIRLDQLSGKKLMLLDDPNDNDNSVEYTFEATDRERGFNFNSSNRSHSFEVSARILEDSIESGQGFSRFYLRLLKSDYNAIGFSFDTETSMLVFDSIFQRGLGEAADYSANKQDFDYVTKMMLDNSLASFTANNGVQRILNNFSVDSTVIRTSGEQTKLNLLRYRFGGIGETLVGSYEYSDNGGEDYNLRVYSNAFSNNVGYYWKQVFTLDVNAGANIERLDYPMIGFKNGVMSIGSETYPLGTLGIESYYLNQPVPVVRNPLTLYVTGNSLFTGRIYAGKSDYANILFLTANDTFYSEGTVYARLGLRTRDAENLLILDGVAWDLGNYAVGTTLTQSHTAFVRIDGKLFKIGLEEVL